MKHKNCNCHENNCYDGCYENDSYDECNSCNGCQGYCVGGYCYGFGTEVEDNYPIYNMIVNITNISQESCKCKEKRSKTNCRKNYKKSNSCCSCK